MKVIKDQLFLHLYLIYPRSHYLVVHIVLIDPRLIIVDFECEGEILTNKPWIVSLYRKFYILLIKIEISYRNNVGNQDQSSYDNINNTIKGWRNAKKIPGNDI